MLYILRLLCVGFAPMSTYRSVGVLDGTGLYSVVILTGNLLET